MTKDVVYATRNCVVYINAVPYRSKAGQARWATDPVVLAKPDLFDVVPPAPDYPNPAARSVEQATAAPGEKRAVRR